MDPATILAIIGLIAKYRPLIEAALAVGNPIFDHLVAQGVPAAEAALVHAGTHSIDRDEFLAKIKELDPSNPMFHEGPQ